METGPKREGVLPDGMTEEAKRLIVEMESVAIESREDLKAFQNGAKLTETDTAQ